MTCPPAAVDAAVDAVAAADALASQLADRIAAASDQVGREVAVDGPATVRMRTALERLAPPSGRASAGGGAHLLRAAGDGPTSWIAVSLARPSDQELLAAWLALAGATDGPLQDGIASVETPALVGAATLVGLPVGVPGEVVADGSGGVRAHDHGPARRLDGPLRVVDLSALWAGPLCAQVLARAGAQVTKVEAANRPDASRTGNPALFAALDRDKAHVVVDLAAPGGPASLRALVAGADVVVEASRPRALEQLGIVAADLLGAADGPTAWVAITGHGRSSPRVAFGDDAAVAGGLVAWDDDGPTFVGDALADPLAGLAAAAATLEALASGRRVLLDVSMAGVAASALTDPHPARDRS